MKFFIKQFFFHYILNSFINKIPFYFIRNLYYKFCGIKLEKGTTIHLNVFIEGVYFGVKRLKIKKNSVIGRFSYVDCRGGIKIGENVSISPYTKIITASHLLNSEKFEGSRKEVIINDFVWIGTGAIILPGVSLGVGSVIGAGAVVSKDVPDYAVVIGNPARIIKYRNKNLNYKCDYKIYFD